MNTADKPPKVIVEMLSQDVHRLKQTVLSLQKQINEKRIKLAERPAFEFRHFLRKLLHLLVFLLRCARLIPPPRGEDFPDTNRELKYELRVISKEVKRLTATCFRLEASIIENSPLSWTRFKIRMGNSWCNIKWFCKELTFKNIINLVLRMPEVIHRRLIKVVFRVCVKSSRHQLGVLFQYRPRACSIAPIRSPRECNSPWPSIQMVIPSYQQGVFLERTIRSILDQGYPNLHLRVHDGGSTDGSVEVIKKYASQLSGWVSQKDGGQSAAIRDGFEQDRAELMSYINSDDIHLPGVLQYVGAYFRAHSEVDVVYGHRLIIDEEDREIGKWYLPRHCNEVLRWADYVPQETMFWRRSIYDRTAGVDTSFKFAMDWDLLIKFQEAGARVVRLPHFLGAFRVHTTQKTSEILHTTGITEMARIRQRLHQNLPDNSEIATQLQGYQIRASLIARCQILENWL